MAQGDKSDEYSLEDWAKSAPHLGHAWDQYFKSFPDVPKTGPKRQFRVLSAFVLEHERLHNHWWVRLGRRLRLI